MANYDKQKFNVYQILKLKIAIFQNKKGPKSNIKMYV